MDKATLATTFCALCVKCIRRLRINSKTISRKGRPDNYLGEFAKAAEINQSIVGYHSTIDHGPFNHGPISYRPWTIQPSTKDHPTIDLD